MCLSAVQVFSIVLSFILYAKPVTIMHIVGGAVFVLSVVITIHLASVKKSKKPQPAGYAQVATSEQAANGKDLELATATPAVAQ